MWRAVTELFDDPDLGDRLIGWACLFIAGFLVGFYVG